MNIFELLQKNIEVFFVEDVTIGLLSKLYSCLWEQKVEVKTERLLLLYMN